MNDCVRAYTLLDAWFGRAVDDNAAARERNKLWFQGTTAFDEHLRGRFGDLPSRLQAGEFSSWRREPSTALARIIALDQVPRNIYRRTPGAFIFDAIAREAAIEAVESGLDARLAPLEATFVYLPFEHAEDEGLQQRSVALFERLLERAPLDLRDLFESYLDYAQRHARVIARFGRFPHRNEILGRIPTPAETAYLASGGQRF